MYTPLRMKNLFYILLFYISVSPATWAQHPHRTPEDMARKQTEMLVRELNIQDSIVRDTLYRMHLKFAHKRQITHTRAEAMQYMQEANAELQRILTPEQYQQFMSQQVNHAPHHPRTHRITSTPIDTTPPDDTSDTTNTPLPLPVSRL